MGEPVHLLRDKIPAQGSACCCRVEPLYGDMQRQAVAACDAFARDFEIYSIDETFLDLSHALRPIASHGSCRMSFY